MLTFSLKITFTFEIHHKKHLLTPKTAAKKTKPTDIKANRFIGFTCEVVKSVAWKPTMHLDVPLDDIKEDTKYKLTSQEIIAWLISGCKENHFYSLPFGQAEASIQLAPKLFD